MKKTLLIALLLIPFLGFSQTTKPVEGFLGIKFGSTKAQVIAAMKAKGGKFVHSDAEENSLYFDNVKLGDRETTAFCVLFTKDNLAYQAGFFFKAAQDPKTIEYYNGLVNDIDEIYGNGKPVKNFKDPYKDGDGYEVTAIQTGNADYYTDWYCDNKNNIKAVITAELDIILLYTDGPMEDQVEASKKAAQKSDY